MGGLLVAYLPSVAEDLKQRTAVTFFSVWTVIHLVFKEET